MTYSLQTHEPQLDDLRFQTLVDEARKRIISYCPEWTEYNVSDPGITLIELFAYMTEALGYRLNQVPRKNYIKFLELLGTQPQPPQPAKTELTFYLSAPIPFTLASGVPDFTTRIKIPAHVTQVATRRSTTQDQEIIFTTDKDLLITPVRLVHLRRDVEDNFDDNYLRRKVKDETFYYESRPNKVFHAFRAQGSPQEGDSFYLGFDEAYNIQGYLLRFDFAIREAAGSGVSQDNPPLVWEYQVNDTTWKSLLIDTDTTLGLNVSGHINLTLPMTMQATEVRGIKAYWIRCRLYAYDRNTQGFYSESPAITKFEAYTIGATVTATHSVRYDGEILGESRGEPNQTFQLPQAPVLPLNPDLGEMIEVEEGGGHDLNFVPWEQVADFSQSSRFSRHYTLDLATGELSFGPTIRQPNGEAQQFGRIPPLRSRIRVTSYRTGGGSIGNVPAGSLQVLKQAINYVAEVTNRSKAYGGQDVEELDQAILNARRSLKTAQRAVTAADYEYLTKEKVAEVARVQCLATNEVSSGTVQLLIVPKVYEMATSSDEEPHFAQLKSDEEKIFIEKLHLYEFVAKLNIDTTLENQIQDVLRPYRILGTKLEITQPTYQAVKVEVQLLADHRRNFDLIRKSIAEALKRLIAPTTVEQTPSFSQEMSLPDKSISVDNRETSIPPELWPFGHNLYLSELLAKIQTVEGVTHITKIELWAAEVKAAQIAEALRTRQPQTPLPEPEWVLCERGLIAIDDDSLPCLLDYNITFMDV